MPWDRESNEEYDDGFTRESFERAEEDSGDEDAIDEVYHEGLLAARGGVSQADSPYIEPLLRLAWVRGFLHGREEIRLAQCRAL